MKATVSCLGALLIALACSGAARADHWFSFGCLHHTKAQNGFTPGCNGYDSYGPSYGANYEGQLPPMPFNGMAPSAAACGHLGAGGHLGACKHWGAGGHLGACKHWGADGLCGAGGVGGHCGAGGQCGTGGHWGAGGLGRPWGACGAGGLDGAGAGRNPSYYPYMRGPRDYFMLDLY